MHKSGIKVLIYYSWRLDVSSLVFVCVSVLRAIRNTHIGSLVNAYPACKETGVTLS